MPVLVNQKLNLSIWINRLQAFVASKKMLPIMAFFVLLSHVAALEMFVITILAFYLVLVFMSKTRIRAVLPPLLMIVYLINSHRDSLMDEHFANMLGYIAVIGGMAVFAFVYGIVKRKLKFRVTWGFLGVLFMGLSLILGGVISYDYDIFNLVIALGFALPLIFLFVVAAFIMQEVSFDYLAHAMITASIVVLLQLFRIYTINNTFYYLGVLTFGEIKPLIVLGWGISNSIAPMIAVAMPFTVYLMTKHKNPIYMLTIFALQIVGIMLTLSRAMIIFALPFALIAIVYAIFMVRKNRRALLQIIIGTLVTLTVAIVVAGRFWEQIVELVSMFGDARGREDLYLDAWETFLRYPIFGSGAAYGHNTHPFAHMFSFYLVHNTLLQFMMWSGTVGMLAFLFHSIQLLATTFRRPSEKRIVLLFAIGMIYMHSMLDVVFFFPATMLYYTFIMAKMDYDAAKVDGLCYVSKQQKFDNKKEINSPPTIYGNNMYLVPQFTQTNKFWIKFEKFENVIL